MEQLPFRSIVVASNNDEYVTLAQARAYANAWGSEFVELGAPFSFVFLVAKTGGVFPVFQKLEMDLRGNNVRRLVFQQPFVALPIADKLWVFIVLFLTGRNN